MEVNIGADKMNAEKIAKILEIGGQDKESNVLVLKKALEDNDYVPTVRGAHLFLDNVSDAMSPDEVLYWKSVAFNL